MAAKDMVTLWEEHVAGEFVEKDEERSLATMVEDALVMHMPTRSGGKGKAELRAYYRDLFIPSIPEEWDHRMTNRVVSDACIVEEATIRMVHSKQMDWFLPGIPPTGKTVTAELVIIIEFRDGKMSAERIYWDHAAVLRQVGHLP